MKMISGVWKSTQELMVSEDSRAVNCELNFTPTEFAGVMAARGLLNNPAMYSGCMHTPISCVRDWVEIALQTGVTFTLFHHHLMFMMESVMSRPEKRVFNTLSSIPAVLDYLEEHYALSSTGT